jgi:hypothetical protein
VGVLNKDRQNYWVYQRKLDKQRWTKLLGIPKKVGQAKMDKTIGYTKESWTSKDGQNMWVYQTMLD